MHISIKKILTDLIEHLKEEGVYELSDAGPPPTPDLPEDYYDYDRGRFMSYVIGSSSGKKTIYDEDLQTILTQMVQMILYKGIIHHSKDGRNVRTDLLVKEQRERLADVI